MGEIKIHEYVKKDATNAMVVISFPTVGLVGNIVANFLINNLKLELIAAMISDDFYPAAIIQNGTPMPPVRIYAGDHICGPDGACDQVVVITSELPVATKAFPTLADKIIEWCRKHKCRVVTTLEGVNAPDIMDTGAKVFHVGSNKAALKQLQGLSSEPMESGMVSGLSGLLLYKGAMQDFAVTCLLAEAHAEFPDSRSAASVIRVIDEMLPQIKMDTGPLLKQAEEIEAQIRKGMSQIKPMAPQELPEVPAGMYR